MKTKINHIVAADGELIQAGWLRELMWRHSKCGDNSSVLQYWLQLATNKD